MGGRQCSYGLSVSKVTIVHAFGLRRVRGTLLEDAFRHNSLISNRMAEILVFSSPPPLTCTATLPPRWRLDTRQHHARPPMPPEQAAPEQAADPPQKFAAVKALLSAVVQTARVGKPVHQVPSLNLIYGGCFRVRTPSLTYLPAEAVSSNGWPSNFHTSR